MTHAPPPGVSRIRRLHATILLAALVAALAACGREDGIVTPPAQLNDFPLGAPGAMPTGTFCGEAMTVPLIASRNREVGSVTVENNGDQLVVRYRTSADAPIGATALFVGSSVDDIPQTGTGNPKVGHFPSKASYPDGTTEVVWTLDRTQPAGTELVVAAYAELEDGEGAWAAGDPIGDGGNWATQFTYVVQSCAAEGLATIPCPDLALAASSATPMDQLAIGAVPLSLGLPLAGQVTWAGGDEETVAFVNRADDGSATLLVPLHPTGTPDGGDVTIRVNDGAKACPAFDLHLNALPPAPGEFSGIVDELQEIIALQASLVGTTVDALKQADATTLPEDLIPLGIAQSVVDRDDNPNSLRAIADGTSATPVDLVLLDRIMARTAFRSALATVLSNATAAAAGTPSPAPGLAASGVAGPAEATNPVDCLANPITTAQVLSDCMNLAESAAFQLQGFSADALNTVNDALALVGLLPAPPIEAAAAGGGLAIWLFQKVMEGTASVLPSDFSGIAVSVSQKSFQEDEDATGRWDAVVGATSKGWKLDQVALEALLQIASLGEEENAWFKEYLPNDLIRNVSAFFRTQFVQDAINTTSGSDFLQIDPDIFGPVSIGDERWSTRSLFTDAFELTSQNVYEPRAVGTGNLHVGTRGVWNGKTQFGGQKISTDQDTVLEVQNLTINFLRDGAPVTEITVGKNETVPLQVQVHDAMYPERVIIDATQHLAGSATMSYSGNATYALTYTAPGDLSQLPDNLVVEDTAHTGSLATSGNTPIAILSILPGGVTIVAPTLCLEPEDTATFSASVVGLADMQVTWTASAGDITSDGFYTASGVASGTDVTITATSVQDPKLSDSVTVHIGNCQCRFDMTLGGAITGSYAGPAGFFDDGGVLQLQFLGHQDPTTGVWTQTGSITTEESFTGAGAYTAAQAAFFDFASGMSAVYDPASGFPGGGSVTVDSTSVNAIWGSFSVTGGTLIPGTDQTQPTTASGTFAAARGSQPYDGLFSPFMQCQVSWTP